MRKSFLAATMLAACGAVSIATTTTVSAKELVYGAFISPKHGVMRYALPVWGKAIAKATNNAITWKFVGGGQLVDVKGSLPGIKEGLVDGAFVIAPFAPSNLPSTNVIFSYQVFGEDTVAAGGASNEAVLLHCPGCLEEAKKNNLVQLGGYATTPYLMMCRKEVKTVADLKGLKIRSAGGGVALVRMSGATPVAMSPTAATQALQRGALDCVHGAASWLRSYGYEDVVKAIVDYPLGMGAPAMHLAVSRKRFREMTPEQRKAHVTASAASVASAVIDAYIVSDAKILARAKKKGIKFIKGGKDFDELAAKRAKAQRDDIIARAKKFNVNDADKIIDAYDKVIEKWKRLSKDIGTDKKKFEAALKREIYDKMDPEKL
ncbi:MAG: TRAP transporter substrate-binding protein DctP [Hyphomicrobiales bacterium]|nr:TRAP transporter substrate-binding protein DctP [Hyphomicrobiales bacterium]